MSHTRHLILDFIRSRQNWDLFGWPQPPLYTESECDYFKMLESERMKGRVEIQGKIVTLADYPEPK